MEASVRDLKEHLSHYLRIVQAGEPVLITSHNKPVARIEPLREGAVPAGVARLAAAEGVLWAGGKPAGARVKLTPGDRSASETVLEDRE